MTSLPSESDVFLDLEVLRATPEGIPYRQISSLVLYDSSGKLAPLLEIVRKGPFIAEDVQKKYWKCPVRIQPILEYSLEYPYGKDAVVWIRSESAFYKIATVAPEYLPLWKPVIEGATLAGHVVNTLLNIPANIEIGQTVASISKISKQNIATVISLLKVHRNFVFKEIKAQNSKVLMTFKLVRALRYTEALEQALTKIMIEQEKLIAISSDGSSEAEDVFTQDNGALFDIEFSLPKIETTIMERPQIIKLPSIIFPSSFVQTTLQPKSLNKGKRSDNNSSILPIDLRELPLPSIENSRFVCPFCGIIIYRTDSANVITILLAHIEASHPYSSLNKPFSTAPVDFSSMERIPEALPEVLIMPSLNGNGIITSYEPIDDLLKEPVKVALNLKNTSAPSARWTLDTAQKNISKSNASTYTPNTMNRVLPELGLRPSVSPLHLSIPKRPVSVLKQEKPSNLPVKKARDGSLNFPLKSSQKETVNSPIHYIKSERWEESFNFDLPSVSLVAENVPLTSPIYEDVLKIQTLLKPVLSPIKLPASLVLQSNSKKKELSPVFVNEKDLDPPVMSMPEDLKSVNASLVVEAFDATPVSNLSGYEEGMNSLIPSPTKSLSYDFLTQMHKVKNIQGSQIEMSSISIDNPTSGDIELEDFPTTGDLFINNSIVPHPPPDKDDLGDGVVKDDSKGAKGGEEEKINVVDDPPTSKAHQSTNETTLCTQETIMQKPGDTSQEFSLSIPSPFIRHAEKQFLAIIDNNNEDAPKTSQETVMSNNSDSQMKKGSWNVIQIADSEDNSASNTVTSTSRVESESKRVSKRPFAVTDISFTSKRSPNSRGKSKSAHSSPNNKNKKSRDSHLKQARRNTPPLGTWIRFPIDVESMPFKEETESSGGMDDVRQNRPLARVVEVMEDCCWRCGTGLAYGIESCPRCHAMQD